MAKVTGDMDAEHAVSLGRRYLIRSEEDTLRQRPLWIRLIIDELAAAEGGDLTIAKPTVVVRAPRPDSDS